MSQKPRIIFLSVIVFLFGALCSMRAEPENADDILNVEERAWLNEHKNTIRLGPDPNAPPLDFFDENGEYKGLTADYVKLIEKKLDFRFKIIRTDSWNELLEMAKRREIDVICAAKCTPDRDKYLLFTEPFIHIPNVIVTRKEFAGDLKMAELRGKKVTMVKGYAVLELISKKYPWLNVETCSNDLNGLLKVSFGEVDAMIIDLTMASYLIEKENISNLRVAGNSGVVIDLGLASRKDWPVLNRILDKGLSQVTEKERKEIFSKWIHLKDQPVFITKRFWIIFSLVFSIIISVFIFVLLWNFILKKKVADKTRELQQSESVYRSLVENIDLGISLVDKDHRIIMSNNKQASFFNKEADYFTGKFCYSEFEKREKVCSHCPGVIAMKTGKPADVETKGFLDDGSSIDVRIMAFPLFENGNPSGFIEIVEDITEKKLADEEKEKLQQQVNNAEKMETIGLLAGGIAHDLNNILGAIVGYPDLILDELPEDSPLREDILAIKESGLRATSIVTDLMSLTLRGIPVDKVGNLNDIVKSYFESSVFHKLQETFPKIEVKKELADDLLNIYVSPVNMQKVIMNLVSNAADAILDEGKICISTKNEYLDFPVTGYDKVEEGEYVVLSVSDDGIGISDEDLKKIFDPFYTKKVHGRSGTGLGMSIVWGTVKDHKGYIDVESKEGSGTTFKIYFPATRMEAKNDAKITTIEKYLGNGEGMLVIDDVKLQRDIATKILKKLNYKVESVASGEEAVEYLQKNSADLLILDMIMEPGINGLETYRRILKIHPKQKAIIVSGFSETKDVKKVQELGAGTYLKKPYRIEAIGMAVKAELEK